MSACSYLLPIRRTTRRPESELTAYLRWVSERAELIVVDGSKPDVFHENSKHWADFCSHVRPDVHIACLNGKVRGVLTGLRCASHDRIVIADDDVRYDERTLRHVVELLDEAEVVQPQNYFDPRPWHAQWDTARTLINRAFGHDSPGTLAVRRPVLLRAGGYSGDVLFENLELLRTIAATGGRVAAPLDCYVKRLPPTARHFASQRVRQAYDEFARPHRLALGLSVLPVFTLIGRKSPTALFLVACAMPAALATTGRARGGGRQFFSRTAVLLAPIWVLERGLCSWAAVWCRLRGGCPYGSARIRVAAHSRRSLMRTLGPNRMINPGS